MTAFRIDEFEARWNRLDPRQRDLLLDAAAVMVWGGLTMALSEGAESLSWAAAATALLAARRLVPSVVLVAVASIHLLTVSNVPMVL
jgi:hypothetical protein